MDDDRIIMKMKKKIVFEANFVKKGNKIHFSSFIE